MAARFTRGFCAISRLAPVRGGAVVALGAFVFTLGCHRAPEPTGSSNPAGPSTGSAAPKAAAPNVPPLPGEPSPTPPVEISWIDPPGLQRVAPKNAMRKASYEVPKAAGDTENGELAVFYFGPGQGGGIEQNVSRWVKQFSDIQPSDVKRADRQANGLREHTVQIVNGTYDGGMPGMGPSGPKKNYALEGAIVESPSGAYFFKMTGPAKTIAAAHGAFMQLLDSVRAS